MKKESLIEWLDLFFEDFNEKTDSIMKSHKKEFKKRAKQAYKQIYKLIENM